MSEYWRFRLLTGNNSLTSSSGFCLVSARSMIETLFSEQLISSAKMLSTCRPMWGQNLVLVKAAPLREWTNINAYDWLWSFPTSWVEMNQTFLWGALMQLNLSKMGLWKPMGNGNDNRQKKVSVTPEIDRIDPFSLS